MTSRPLTFRRERRVGTRLRASTGRDRRTRFFVTPAEDLGIRARAEDGRWRTTSVTLAATSRGALSVRPRVVKADLGPTDDRPTRQAVAQPLVAAGWSRTRRFGGCHPGAVRASPACGMPDINRRQALVMEGATALREHWLHRAGHVGGRGRQGRRAPAGRRSECGRCSRRSSRAPRARAGNGTDGRAPDGAPSRRTSRTPARG